MQAFVLFRADPIGADEVVSEAARFPVLVIPAQAGIQAAFRHRSERHWKTYVSRFRLSPERRTGRNLRSVQHP